MRCTEAVVRLLLPVHGCHGQDLNVGETESLSTIESTVGVKGRRGKANQGTTSAIQIREHGDIIKLSYLSSEFI